MLQWNEVDSYIIYQMLIVNLCWFVNIDSINLNEKCIISLTLSAWLIKIIIFYNI